MVRSLTLSLGCFQRPYHGYLIVDGIKHNHFRFTQSLIATASGVIHTTILPAVIEMIIAWSPTRVDIIRRS